MNRLAVTRVNLNGKPFLAYVLLDENRNMTDFQLFDEAGASLLNQICIGRVENIVTNIHGAFVRISPEQRCYLSLEDLKSPLFTKKQSEKKDLSVGDELLVQVIKDEVKTKEPVVSTKLTLTGTYTLITTDNTALSISKKINTEKREALLKVLDEIRETAEEYSFGVILRTNSAEVSVDEVSADLQKLVEKFLAIKTKGIHQTAFTVLEKDEAAYIRKMKSLDIPSLDRIYTDEKDVYDTISKELPYLVTQKLLEYYVDNCVSLKKLYHIDGFIEELLKKKVWLKSGANIIIEQLETMTVIDVNSGKNMSKSERAFCEINKEAAVEIARQLRLRNISGMIIIDFINMKTEDQMDEVTTVLKQALKKDPVPSNLMDVTKLGLVEVTRKKTCKSLIESIQ